MPFKIDDILSRPEGSPISLRSEKPMRGLGDAVATVAEPGKAFIQRFWANFFANCNCEAKRKWLNDHFPFKQKR